jgi:hypothetical protein
MVGCHKDEDDEEEERCAAEYANCSRSQAPTTASAAAKRCPEKAQT